MKTRTLRACTFASVGLSISSASLALGLSVDGPAPTVLASDEPSSDGSPAPIFGASIEMDWYTIDGGGATFLTGGTFELGATLGQPDAGTLSDGASFDLAGGFWGGVNAPTTCYANCDGSTGEPALTAADFTCFLTRFRNADPWANCDGSTGTPALSAADFSCYLTKFRAGCP